MKRGRNIESFFIKKTKPTITTSPTVIPSIPTTESPSSQDTEPSASVTVPGKMPSPGPSAITSDSEPEIRHDDMVETISLAEERQRTERNALGLLLGVRSEYGC